MLNSIDPSNFPNLDGKKCSEDRHNLALLRDELLFMIKNSENISKHIEVKNAISYIQEVDNNYRVLLAAYNADVLGYNYWIHFLPSRFIFKVLVRISIWLRQKIFNLL